MIGIGIAIAGGWLATSAAIIYAIYATGRISALWFFLIPAPALSYSRTTKVEKKEEGEQDKTDNI